MCRESRERTGQSWQVLQEQPQTHQPARHRALHGAGSRIQELLLSKMHTGMLGFFSGGPLGAQELDSVLLVGPFPLGYGVVLCTGAVRRDLAPQGALHNAVG